MILVCLSWHQQQIKNNIFFFCLLGVKVKQHFIYYITFKITDHWSEKEKFTPSPGSSLTRWNIVFDWLNPFLKEEAVYYFLKRILVLVNTEQWEVPLVNIRVTVTKVFLPVILLFRHSVVFSSLWPRELQALQASLSFTLSQSLLRFMFIESVMPSKHLILCCPLLLLPSIFPSTRVFSNESALHIRWPKYWSFSFSISPSNEYSGLIFFRIDWFDLLVVQGTLKSLF